MKNKRALVICAHDDDEVIGMGGTIRRLADSGVRVTTLIFANGNEGYTRLAEKDTIVARRARERQAAQRILGTAACVAHAHRDFENLDGEGIYRQIIQAVRAVRPQVVFTHMPADYMAHRTLARVAPEAVWQAGWECSLELGEPWKAQALYHFPIIELIPKPSHLVDITRSLKAKLQAMEAYASQHTVVAGIRDQLEAKARAYGTLIGVKYAEAFMQSQFLPVAVSDPVALWGK